MLSNDEIRERVSPHLPLGETYVVAFAAVSGFAPRLAWRHRVVAVTERRIHLFAASPWKVCAPRRLLASLPVGTPLVTTRTLWYEEMVFAGDRVWVVPAYAELVAEAIRVGAVVRSPDSR